MRKRLGFLLVLVVLFGGSSVQALTVLQLNLAQLTELSEKVFVGKCVSVKIKKDVLGRSVQSVTFKVSEMIKGVPTSTVTFKQLASLGVRKSGELETTDLVSELPQYKVGEEAIVFLSAEGKKGLTAPVGLFQGKFDVVEQDGLKVVKNGISNRGLFMGLQKTSQFNALQLNSSENKLLSLTPGSALPQDDFISLVKKLGAE